MKRSLALCTVSAALLLFAAGCKDTTSPTTSTPPPGWTASDFQERTYVLETVDGKPVSAGERAPTLEFAEDFRVSGSVCNRFTGQGSLNGNVMTVSQMASTKMLCMEPELNDLENQFSRMMQDGVMIDKNGERLTLTRDGHVWIYRETGRVGQ